MSKNCNLENCDPDDKEASSNNDESEYDHLEKIIDDLKLRNRAFEKIIEYFEKKTKSIKNKNRR